MNLIPSNRYLAADPRKYSITSERRHTQTSNRNSLEYRAMSIPYEEAVAAGLGG